MNNPRIVLGCAVMTATVAFAVVGTLYVVRTGGGKVRAAMVLGLTGVLFILLTMLSGIAPNLSPYQPTSWVAMALLGSGAFLLSLFWNTVNPILWGPVWDKMQSRSTQEDTLQGKDDSQKDDS